MAKPISQKFNNPGTSNDLCTTPLVVDQNMDTGKHSSFSFIRKELRTDMILDAADFNGNSNLETTLNVNGSANIELPVTTTTFNIPTASKLNCTTKRTRQPDASTKFNRSNRKSKNCAIFYFKHLDTDSENKGWSSQTSEVA